jgi:GT2 family glycosyltransferase
LENQGLKSSSFAQMISISIVSHLQADLVKQLLFDIDKYCRDQCLEVLLTLNLPESLAFCEKDFSFPVFFQVNQNPMGFGTNHNQAFKLAQGGYFCIVNPDIRLDKNPFPFLLKCLEDATVGIVAPLVVHPDGGLEDSARRFPTPQIIFAKALGNGNLHDYAVQSTVVYPDWVGGMFMLFQRDVFQQCGGFDERYFLYYEDVDLCGRLNLLGFRIALCPLSSVVHHAQRSSHRSWRYMRWHLASMLRFFLSPVYWRLKRLRHL